MSAMSVVTIQRSPTPSDVEKEDVVDSPDLCQHGASCNKSSSASEDFLAVKGAAVALPQDSRRRESLPSGQGQLPTMSAHLHRILHTLRSSDTLKLAVMLERVPSSPPDNHRYVCVVSCTGRQGYEESVLLGMDLTPRDTTVGLVLPVMQDMSIKLDGDGGFKVVIRKKRDYLFKPVSVQALWTSFQRLDQVLKVARCNNYFPNGLNHVWVSYYESRIKSQRHHINEWFRTDDSEPHVDTPPREGEEADERARMEHEIRGNLREIMVSVDLDDVTVLDLRKRLAEKMDCDLQPYKKFIGESVLFILGQLDSPTKIFDHVYLGSKWNACNLEELQTNGVEYILNITKEIDNFYPDVMTYSNIREYDEEKTDLLQYWEDTHRFINMAREKNSRVLVHCKMGVSRSASTVMAYAMKQYGWTLARAQEYVTNLRSCVYPNKGFMKQLKIYEGMLAASYNRSKFAEESAPVAVDDGGSAPSPLRRTPTPRRGQRQPLDSVDVAVPDEPINVEQDIFQYKQNSADIASSDIIPPDSTKSSDGSSGLSNRSLATDPMEEARPGSPMDSGCGGHLDPRMKDLVVKDKVIEQREPKDYPWRRSLRRKNEKSVSSENCEDTETPVAVIEPPTDDVTASSPTQSMTGSNRRLRADSSWIQLSNNAAGEDTLKVDRPDSTHPVCTPSEAPTFFLGGEIPGEETSTDSPTLSSLHSKDTVRASSWPLAADVPDNLEARFGAAEDPSLRSSLPRSGIVQEQSSRLMLQTHGAEQPIPTVEVTDNPRRDSAASDGQGDSEMRRSLSCSLYQTEDGIEPGIVAKTRESIEARQRTTSETMNDQRLSCPAAGRQHGDNGGSAARYFSALSLNTSPSAASASAAAAGGPQPRPASFHTTPTLHLCDADQLGGESCTDADLPRPCSPPLAASDLDATLVSPLCLQKQQRQQEQLELLSMKESRPVYTAKTLLTRADDAGAAVTTPVAATAAITATAAPRQRCLRLVTHGQAVEGSVDQEPIQPVSQLVKKFHNASAADGPASASSPSSGCDSDSPIRLRRAERRPGRDNSARRSSDTAEAAVLRRWRGPEEVPGQTQPLPQKRRRRQRRTRKEEVTDGEGRSSRAGRSSHPSGASQAVVAGRRTSAAAPSTNAVAHGAIGRGGESQGRPGRHVNAIYNTM